MASVIPKIISRVNRYIIAIKKAYNRLFAKDNAERKGKIFKGLKNYFDNTSKEQLDED